jgi:hypothetical protein
MKDQQTTEDTCPQCFSTEAERSSDSFNCPCLQPRDEAFYLANPESIDLQFSCTKGRPEGDIWFSTILNTHLNMKNNKTPEKVIGWSGEIESQIKRNLEAAKLAYTGLQNAYASQGVEFSLDPEAALKAAADSVQITGSREIPVAKRLDLLGINPAVITSSHYSLVQACSAANIKPEDLNENGEVSEDLRAELMSACVVKAEGEDAVQLATALERCGQALSEFFNLMQQRGQNRPNAAAVGQLTNGMLAMNADNTCAIVPYVMQQYVKRN